MKYHHPLSMQHLSRTLVYTGGFPLLASFDGRDGALIVPSLLTGFPSGVYTVLLTNVSVGISITVASPILPALEKSSQGLALRYVA